MNNEHGEIEKYADKYSDDGLKQKISQIAQKAGAKIIHTVLLLYYALQNPQLSNKDRAIIIGALGYFILPFDLVPDFIAGLGFTDDLATLLYALRTVYTNITPDVKQKATETTRKWFPDFSSDTDEIAIHQQ